jgi:DNA-binding NarL/FixJ family response regulator
VSVASTGRPAPPQASTDREPEVLRLIGEGSTDKGAARRLFISEAAVKTRLLRLYAELGVRDRAAPVAAAHRSGLLG